MKRNARTHARPNADAGADDDDETTPGRASEQTPLLNGAVTDSLPAEDDRQQPVDEAKSERRPLGVARGVCVAFSLWLLIFIQSTNMSGMAIIQGTVAASLHAYPLSMWFTTAFLISMSSLAPLAGRLASALSSRALVPPISVLVALGGLVTATAQSGGVFVAGRVLTGAGGAGVMTLALILVLELTGEERRGLFIGLVNACFTTGVSCGAVIFGALVPVVGWRPLFWAQIPLSIVSGIALYMSIPNSATPATDKSESVTQKLLKIDYLGAGLLVSTIVLFLYSLAGDFRPYSLLASVFSLALFLATEYLVAADPVIPLKVLSSRGVLLSCLAQLGLMSARWSVLFYAPILALSVRGAAPAAAGSVLIPTNLGFALGGTAVGWLHVRRSGAYWLPTLVSITLFCAALYGLSIVAAAASSIPLPVFVALLFANGAVTGAALNYTLAHLLHLCHHDTQYISTSLLGTFRGFGGSFGTSIGGGIFYRLLRARLTDGFLALDGADELSPSRQRLISKLLGTPELVHHGGLSPAAQDVAIQGYAGAISGVWKAAVVLGVMVIFVQACTGWTAPEGEHRESETEAEIRAEENEARVNVGEHEGIGEA